MGLHCCGNETENSCEHIGDNDMYIIYNIWKEYVLCTVTVINKAWLCLHTANLLALCDQCSENY